MPSSTPTPLRWFYCSRGLLGAMAIGLVGTAGSASGESLEPRASMENKLAPFVAAYCVDCHTGEEAEAGLVLDKLMEAPSVPHRRLQWQRVLERLEKNEMPPEEGEQPPAEERQEIVAWLSAELADPDCSVPQDPGRVTLRRLNREEYQNTVRDLLGVEFDAEEAFPRDELGFGFDNNADVLSLPPVLLEKYLEAAEDIAKQAIVTPESILEPAQTIDWKELDGGDAAARGARALISNGRVWAPVTLDKPGEYLLRIRAYGSKAGDELPLMRMFVDGDEVRSAKVGAASNDPQTYVARFTSESGDHMVGADFMNDHWEPWEEDPTRRDRNLYVMSVTVVGPVDKLAAENLPESHRRIVSWTPPAEQWASGKEWVEPTRELIGRLLIRAYRQPPAAKDINRVMKLVRAARNQGDSFERAMQLAVEATLVSPKFLFRGEEGAEVGAQGVQNLSEYELASRLSYFLWSSMPDEELLKLAADGSLRTQLAAQVDRMLASPRADELIRNFGEQWLETRRIDSLQKSGALFPEFDRELREALREETFLLLRDVIRNDRPLTTLLSADYSFLNGRLAQHYGLSEPKGDEFVRTTLPVERQAGLLAHGGVMAVTSFPDRTSPVLRGKWVLDHLLADPPPPPPPGVSDLPDATGDLAGKSLRERLEVHRANPSCAVCHNRMDPLGLVLENFDAVGRWREKDGAFAINPAGKLPDGRELSGPSGLRDVLLADFPRIRRAIAEKLLTFALGRGLEPSDECAIDEIVAAGESRGDTFSGMVRGVVASTPFQKLNGSSNASAQAAGEHDGSRELAAAAGIPSGKANE